MTEHPPDIRYAYLCLGLEVGAPLERITEAFTHALSYRFRTRDRIDTVRRMMEFFAARHMLGSNTDAFSVIQKSYREKVRELHPDLNPGDPQAEEKVKEINVAYGIIEAIHREAIGFFQQPEADQHAMEIEARLSYQRETGTPRQERREEAKPPVHERRQQEKPSGGSSDFSLKYMAASVPRNIRMSRLYYLPPECVIGSWHTRNRDGSYISFDILMLREREFNRARIHLSVPNVTDPVLTRGGFSPTYIVKDVREITIPAGTYDPAAYARAHFMKEFKLNEGNG
jgi:hypothetical protein